MRDIPAFGRPNIAGSVSAAGGLGNEMTNAQPEREI